MSKDYASLAKQLEPWYHRISITADYTTQSYLDVDHHWANNRTVRAALDYRDKSVLDLGTMDGMWAFEAESLGARVVVAADIWQNCIAGYHRFMLAHEARGSKVMPVVNGDVHSLYSKLASPMLRLGIDGFDIIQCLGLLYHVQNPWLALHQIRRCLSNTGTMLLETALWDHGGDVPMMRANFDLGTYDDASTFWIPNLPCLLGLLVATGFTPKLDSVSIVEPYAVRRVAMICTAGPKPGGDDNFGLNL